MMAEEDRPSSSLLPPVSASETINMAVTGLSLLFLTPSTSASLRLRHSIRQSSMKPKCLFGITVGLGDTSSTGLEVTHAAAPIASSHQPPQIGFKLSFLSYCCTQKGTHGSVKQVRWICFGSKPGASLRDRSTLPTAIQVGI